MKAQKDVLKFITCGSVDDGKSTLIGHMLYDAKMIFADQEQSIALTAKLGTRSDTIDYSLLLDGLMAEREQGITIDVAYRYFSTENRNFIVADCPGHEQYTRNMAVGASFADLAIILVDASQGVLAQTKRHTKICALMGIKHFVLAVNKMDLIDYDEKRFKIIRRDFEKLCIGFEIESIQAIPLSATLGDNITRPSSNTPWYREKPLFTYLEEVKIGTSTKDDGFIMPVQRVSRPHADFRGYQGQIESGQLSVGDQIRVLPSGMTAQVTEILCGDQFLNKAYTSQAVTLCLDKEIDVSRGCVFTNSSLVKTVDMFRSAILWMSEQKLVPGRDYLLKCGTKKIPSRVMAIKHRLDINSEQEIVSDALMMNELGQVEILLDEAIPLTTFKDNQSTGSFILIDRLTHETVACGTIQHELRRSTNVKWQDTEITRSFRASQKHQDPMTIWFTGLSGAGKTTLANAVEKRLVALGKHTILLDGDNVRHGLNKDLSFKECDRVENVRRVAEVSKLMNDAGLIVLAAFISPYEKDRQVCREIIGRSYKEIYVSTDLEICEKRDVKGLYQKARKGELLNFTGIQSVYEPPIQPDYTVDSNNRSIDDLADEIVNYLIA